MRQPTAIRAMTIIERLGFRPLGEITVGSNGGLRFPAPPDCGGLYFIAFRSGGYYVGETGRYAGRFDHYTNPADDIWTELVINAMLIDGGGGHIHIREEPVAGKSQRRRMEAAVVRDFLVEGVPLWNEGGGRCEKTYLAWKIPIIERMLATASARYAEREELKPYSIERLRKLPRRLEQARAKAQQLGLDSHAPSMSPAVTLEVALAGERHANPLNPVRAAPAQPATRPNRPADSRLMAHKARRERKDTQQAIAHRFLAAHPDATCEELLRAHPDTFNTSTAQTLWRDYRMTLKAMGDGEHQPDEDETLTIRRVACRLWDIHPGSVTKEMVEEELNRRGHARKRETVRAIAGNTISTLEAFAALRPSRPAELSPCS
jgi:hypothetical protein